MKQNERERTYIQIKRTMVLGIGIGLSLVMLALPTISRAADPGRYMPTHSDPWIPNVADPSYATQTILSSVKNGNWSDAATWGGKLPTATNVVVIRHAVTFDTSAEVYDLAVYPGGTLSFRTDSTTYLKLGTMEVMSGGQLIIGTQASPMLPTAKAEIVFKDRAIDLTRDPGQYGNGLLVVGTVSMYGAARTPTFVRLTREPQVGDKTLSLELPVSGWQAGDRLILPDSRQLKSNEREGYYISQLEELTLAGVSGDGLTITLSSPLQYKHPAGRDADGTIKFLPHVGNLTRNIVFRSENPAGTRGHTLYADTAQVDVRNVLFRDLGRTVIWQPDNTTFDANGNATHIGTNQIARYPIHTHHLYGPAGSNTGSYQFILMGNAVDGGSTTNAFKWGITIHGSHYGLIQQNIVYNMAGSGLSTEDGSESYNLIQNNFIVRIFGLGGRGDSGGDPFMGTQGRGFWFRGPNNYVRDNVVANVNPVLFTFGYEYFAKYLGPILVPNFPGADPMVSSNWHYIDGNGVPILDFTGNEAYGALDSGMTVWWIGGFGDIPKTPSTPSVIKNLKLWNFYYLGFFNYEISNMVIDGITIRGDVSSPENTGLFLVDYMTDQMVVQNADIQGMGLGIYVPTRLYSNPNFVVQNSYLRNATNISVTYMWNCCYYLLPARIITINNVKFDPMGNAPLRTISMDWIPDSELSSQNVDLTRSTKVLVQNYNQVQGANFQVYFLQQNPNTVVPLADATSAQKHTGAPVAGLTNQQTWSMYQIALGGALTPCLDTTSHPEIYGYTCNGTSITGTTTAGGSTGSGTGTGSGTTTAGGSTGSGTGTGSGTTTAGGSTKKGTTTAALTAPSGLKVK